MAYDKLVAVNEIRNRIYTIRGVQVMIDADLAELYQVETKALNQAVKRNIGRFPERFCFQLSTNEKDELVTNCDRLNRLKHSSACPYAFTESGVAMLSSVLRSDVAVQVSVNIMDAFVAMRHFISENAIILDRLDRIELKQLEADKNFKEIFKRLEEPREKKAVIFSDGQLWDAASCIEEIFKKANRSITVIDKYVDNKTLDLLSKKNDGVSVVIVTDQSCATLTETDIENFNKQYGNRTFYCSQKQAYKRPGFFFSTIFF